MIASFASADMSSAVSIKSRQSRARGGSVSSLNQINPTPARLIVASQPLSVSEASISNPRDTRDGSSLGAEGQPNRTPLATRHLVRSLLNQLTEIHDRQQSIQKAEWDVFLRRRRLATGSNSAWSTSKISGTTTALTSTTGGGQAAAMLGLSRFSHHDEEEVSYSNGLVGLATMGLSSNKEDSKEFVRLVRAGIPLTYRAKVWSECSGALEIAEPGVFQDLLSYHQGESNPTLADIEKDVRRTSEHALACQFGGSMAISDLPFECQQTYFSAVMELALPSFAEFYKRTAGEIPRKFH
jgi:hypothetical protein